MKTEPLMKKKAAATDTPLSATSDAEQFSNDELIERCTQLGGLSVKARRMFMGLLPLVARRAAYNPKKFSSIHHFASIVGGVGYDLVDEILRLDRQLEGFPKLRNVLYSGEIGWAKIRLVISMVTKDDQDRWLELLRALSKPALEVYLRDFRKQEAERHNIFSNIIEVSCTPKENILESPSSQENAVFEAPIFPGKTLKLDDESEIGQTGEDEMSQKEKELSSKRETLSFSVNQWLAAQLRLFRRELEKDRKRLITWQDVLAELLKRAI